MSWQTKPACGWPLGVAPCDSFAWDRRASPCRSGRAQSGWELGQSMKGGEEVGGGRARGEAPGIGGPRTAAGPLGSGHPWLTLPCVRRLWPPVRCLSSPTLQSLLLRLSLPITPSQGPPGPPRGNPARPRMSALTQPDRTGHCKDHWRRYSETEQARVLSPRVQTHSLPCTRAWAQRCQSRQGPAGRD